MSLQEVWDAASGSPFNPAVSKENQFTVGFLLLLFAVVLTGLFGLSTYAFNHSWRCWLTSFRQVIPQYLPARNSRLAGIRVIPLRHLLSHLTVYSFGAVYMFCAAGVYV